MSFARRVGIGLSLLFLVGCRDYDSLTPLGPASAGWIDSSLLATWRCAPAEGGEAALVSFQQFDETQYVVDVGDGDQRSAYRVYSSSVGEAAFLNAQEVKDASLSERGFTFLRYAFTDGGSLEIQSVVRELFETAEGTGLPPGEVLKRALEDPDTFTALLNCVREPGDT